MRYQTEETKAGEVKMRRSVAMNEIEPRWDILGPRMEETIEIFSQYIRLYGMQIDYSTVVCEIGAERCQRLLAVMGEWGIQRGQGIDLSEDMLSMAPLVAKHYGIKYHGLTTYAGDVLELKEIRPSPDIVFAIATVHHFPDPRPLFRHVYRLLAPGGWFIFDREPLKSWLGLHEVIRWWRARGRVTDRDWGVLEDSFTLAEWREAFGYFDWSEVRISFPPFKRKFKVRWFHQITGGRLSGVLRK